MKEEVYFWCSQLVQPGRSSSGLKEDDRTHPGWNSASQYMSIEIKGLIFIGDLGWDHCSGHVKIHVNQENRAWVDFSLSCTFSTPKTSLDYTWSIAIAMVKWFFLTFQWKNPPGTKVNYPQHYKVFRKLSKPKTQCLHLCVRQSYQRSPNSWTEAETVGTTIHQSLNIG